MKSDTIVIIPTYNEKENIEAIIRAVTSLEKPFDILVIDDGSPDGTADIVKRLMQGELSGRVHIVERSGKLGLGTAYICGFKWALENGYDYVIEMDADFSHAPSDLPRLYAACHDEGYDVSVGSRYITGVNVVNCRDEVHSPAPRLQDKGSSRGLRQPRTGHKQDVRRHLQRSALRRAQTEIYKV